MAAAGTLPPVLQVRELVFAHPGQAPLFDGWCATLPPGLTAVLGDESSGKTTLLRLLAGDLQAQAGNLRLNGSALHDTPAPYRQQVFRTEPRSEAFEQVTAEDFLTAVQGSRASFDPTVAAQVAEALALGPHLHKPLYMLSTGSRRKLWLAAAFASGAALTLVDEPFGGLDRASIGAACALLREQAAGGRAWVIADYEAPPGVPLAQTLQL